MNYITVDVSANKQTATLCIARPEVKNAFNEAVIVEILEALGALAANKALRLLKISGKGGFFSAGADLQWMKQVAGYSYEENLRESDSLQQLFQQVYKFPAVTLARVEGGCFGGANGLVAAADLAVAEENAIFRFSEVALGLVPATIAPYVIRKTGEYAAKHLMLTAQPFSGKEAAQHGLVNQAVPAHELDKTVAAWEKRIQKNAPGAMRHTKALLNQLSAPSQPADTPQRTAEAIARARISPEGQEGIAAFLEKRKPEF